MNIILHIYEHIISYIKHKSNFGGENVANSLIDISTINLSDPYVIAGIIVAVIVICGIVLYFTGYWETIKEKIF